MRFATDYTQQPYNDTTYAAIGDDTTTAAGPDSSTGTFTLTFPQFDATVRSPLLSRPAAKTALEVSCNMSVFLPLEWRNSLACGFCCAHYHCHRGDLPADS